MFFAVRCWGFTKKSAGLLFSVLCSVCVVDFASHKFYTVHFMEESSVMF